MPRLGFARLPELRSAEDLLDFLRGLGWPLPADALVDGLTFDWTGEDLHLPAAADERLAGGSVRQLRTMTAGQPWGIFLVEFAQLHLYRTALRGVLRGLVPNRRRDPSLAAWQHANLLFLCATANYAQVTFAHFRGEAAGRARLATFGWEQGSRYARTLLEFNVPALVWPARPADATAWLQQWSRAFAVDPVTVEFFRVYSEVFYRVEALVTGLADNEKRRMWAQRLFNRLMFIAFVEKKGWLCLGERTDYLAALWEAWERTGPSFYAARLKPLFFLALNNPGERDGGVPYLNGGLFDQDEDDRDAAVGVPNEAIGTILNDLFARFNFTATENTPLDVEVAVDPEMLGKVFEELVTGRHESGSYYTPKPVVAFMCREALKHYLAGATTEAPAALAGFVDRHDPAGLRDGEATLGALKRVRVCDPACGSGAYLLGMLHELVDLRECLFATRRLDTPSAHARKLEIIRHNLYGVDLDPFAVNIARLRLWLSLTVEYDGATPPPLPNLDFKIEAGDSLGAPDPQGVFNAGQGALRARVAQQFQEAKAAYLLAHGDDKTARRGEVEALRDDLKIWLQSEAPAGAFDWAVEFAEVFAPRSATTEAGGFDIVMANPPYVRQELIKAQKPILKARYECFDGYADLFVYFYERAVKILKNGGTLAFISSNKYYRAGYGAKLREFLVRETSVQTVIDFGDTPVFGAIAYASILIATRTRPEPLATARVLTWTGERHFGQIAETFAEQAKTIDQNELGRDGWRLESTQILRLLVKLRGSGIPLGDWVKGRIYRGILTGFNEVFVVDRATRDRLIGEHASSADILKPFLRGRDVKRWQTNPQDLWLIFTRRGVNIGAYPAILGFLSAHRAGLMPGGPGGRKPGSYQWYELQDNIAYWQEFTAPKIIIPAITARSEYAVDDEGYFSNDKTSICVPDEPGYVAAVLNSAPADWFIRKTAAERQGGFFEFKPMYVSAIPIPDAAPAERAALSDLAERCRDAKRSGDSGLLASLEAEINQRVFRLYGLTPEEQNIIVGRA